MKKVAKYEMEEVQMMKSISKEESKGHFISQKKLNKLKPHQIFDALIKKEARLGDIYLSNRGIWAMIYGFIDKPKNFIEFVMIILQKSETFIDDIGNVNSLPAIFKYYLRSNNYIESWVPKRNNPKHQLSDLLRYLYAKYEVPAFLDGCFTNYSINTEAGIELFLHIGSGQSFKKFKYAPELVYTGKVYHYILNTPKHFTYFEAFRRAQIMALGGDEKLSNAFLRSKLGRFQDTIVRKNNVVIERAEDFWVSVIKLFIDSGMFNLDKISEIVDYIHHVKYVGEIEFGVRTAKTSYSMKGRTLGYLLEKSDTWHREQAINARIAQNQVMAQRRNIYGRQVVVEFLTWLPINIPNYSQNLMVSPREGVKKESVNHKIIQLTSTKQLIEEGKSNRNCVGSYSTSCASGKCSIFSLRTTGTNESHATIEIRNNEAVQIRGFGNRRILNTSVHYKMITDWLKMNFIKLSNNAF